MKTKKIRQLSNFLFKRHGKKTAFVSLLLMIGYYFCLPNPLFNDPTSFVLESADGNLLGAKIAKDGQWRFPHATAIPDKFKIAITEFEDRRFYSHIGIDIKGIGRAIVQNIRNQKVVSGASTISMQTIRLATKPSSRSFFQKVWEMIRATRLEFRYSKDEILAYYASNAPFGGNVVGLEAASWRYYGKQPALLSWGEATTLAVLPNSPALIHPGRNRSALLAKRNRLLDRLLAQGKIDEITNELAKEEPLPQKPLPLPRLAPHLLERARKNHTSDYSKVATTIQSNLQSRANKTVQRHVNLLKDNGIHNACAIILDVETGNVLSYVGNAPSTGKAHHEAVDIVTAPRSTGSILKPILYALAQQEGKILPESLLSDIPTSLNGYKPVNYATTYDGAVKAKRAVSRSLNIPLIRLLQKYGLEKFHYELQALNCSHINQPASHYGLPLIVGGAEASLWDITAIYASMARTVMHFQPYNSRYSATDFRAANYDASVSTPTKRDQDLMEEHQRISASGAWLAFEAMREVERPNAQGEWKRFGSSKQIAWKTGTSFGFRDAWAVGATSRYVVGVWAGNADGEGRPGCVGVKAAAPILFDLFDLLPDTGEWFEQPYDEMLRMPVCKQSGYRATDICEVDSMWVSSFGVNAPPCKYHKALLLDQSHKYQVNTACETPFDIERVSFFQLPPIEAHYYQSKNPSYQVAPPLRTDCRVANATIRNPMQLIYPKKDTKIYIPRNLDGTDSKTVFQAAHTTASKEVFWHIDNIYYGSTKDFHNMEFKPEIGHHELTLVDEDGFEVSINFEVE